MLVFETSFDGISRLRLWFATANQAGAFLCCLLPILFSATESAERNLRRIARRSMLEYAYGYILWACSIAIWLLLARTGSRAAWLGATAALIVYVTNKTGGRRKSCVLSSTDVRHLAAHFCIFVLSVIVGGFSGRASLGFVANDLSIGNRLQLWAGGCALFSGEPLRGWGEGVSGRVFMDYIQLSQNCTGYSTMVNSYLTLAVERGALACIAYVSFSVGMVLIGFVCKGDSNERTSISMIGMHYVLGPEVIMSIRRTGSAIWAAWIVVNIFSTLSTTSELWILPLVSAAAALFCSRRCALSMRVGVISVAVALGCIVIASIYATGSTVSNKLGYKVHKLADGIVRFERIGGACILSRPSRFVFLLDDQVLGERPIKEIRDWFIHADEPFSIDVCEWRASSIASIKRSDALWVVFGKATSRLGEIECAVPLLLVAPIWRSNMTKVAKAKVVVSSYNSDMNNELWYGACDSVYESRLIGDSLCGGLGAMLVDVLKKEHQ